MSGHYTPQRSSKYRLSHVCVSSQEYVIEPSKCSKKSKYLTGVQKWKYMKDKNINLPVWLFILWQYTLTIKTLKKDYRSEG